MNFKDEKVKLVTNWICVLFCIFVSKELKRDFSLI